MSKVNYSEIESDVYNLKVGRANLEIDSVASLSKTIIDEEYDVCRVKIDSNNNDLISQIEQTGLPTFLSGSLIRFKIDFRRHKVPPYRYNPEFVLYDGSQKKALREVLINTFDEYPTSFYSIPNLEKVISIEQQQETLCKYFIDSYKNSNIKVWLVKLNGEYGGMLAADYWEDSCDAILAGVTPKFRNGALFLDIVRFIQNYCVDNKIPWGYTGARLHEVVSQKFFSRESMRVFKTELIFHITSFLSKTLNPIVLVDIKEMDKNKILSIIFNELPRHSSGKFLVNHQFHWYSQSSKDLLNLKAHLSFPILDNISQLIVVKIKSNDKLIGLGYFNYSK